MAIRATAFSVARNEVASENRLRDDRPSPGFGEET